MKPVLAFILLCLWGTAAFAQLSATPVTRTNVTADNLLGKLYRPSISSGNLPAVIVLGGSEGGLDPAVSAQARLIARHGYAALQLAYFGAARLPETVQLIPLEYFMRAVAWLRRQPGIDPDHIGIVGTSIGGETVLLLAAHDPAITAVVAAVPSNVVWQGLGGGITRHPTSSFALHDVALPDLPYGWNGGLHDAYGRYTNGLETLSRYPEAIIPVETINGPVMLICGARDTVWPSCRMAALVVARLKAKGFHHPVTFLDFPRAGHAVFGVPLPPSNPDYPDLGSLGGTPEANAAARDAAWPQCLTFLDAALKPGRQTSPSGSLDPADEPRTN